MKLLGTELPAALDEAAHACRRHLVLAAAFSALVNILYLAPTIYMMQVYDRVVPTGGVITLLSITAAVAFAIGTLAALEAVRTRLMLRAALRLDRLLAGEILDRLLGRRGRGDAPVGQAMREFETLRQTFGGSAMVALFDAPWTPLYLAVAFIIHPLLGALVLAGGGALVAVAIANERATKARAHEAHRAMAYAGAAQDAVAGRAEVVRALGMRGALVARLLRDRQAGLALHTRAQFAGGRFAALAKFLRLFLQSLALGTGAWLAVERQISVGAIIAASVLLSRALQPIELLVGSWRQVMQAREALTTLGRLFETTAASRAARTALPVPVGRIAIEKAVVRAPGREEMLLKGVSLDAAPGEVLGIVGPSGAGKTTLARVLAGAIEPEAGAARIDGADYRDWDADRLARHIGYLPQEPSLFAGTVAENIARFELADGGDPHEVAAAVVAAATAADAHAMILKLPGGYEARLGDGGTGLSAGQAQRIALARALYREPCVLVLDEPNSALDAEGEAALAAAIDAARTRGGAVMIVAHRLGILSGADRLAVVANGLIDRIGPQPEILAYLHGRVPAANVVEMKGA